MKKVKYLKKIGLFGYFLIMCGAIVILLSSLNVEIIPIEFKRSLFVFLSLFFVCLIPIALFIIDQFKDKLSISQDQKNGALIMLVLFSSIFSYILSNKYSGQYMNFEKMRPSVKKVRRPVVWVGNNVAYYIECPNGTKPMYIKGEAGDIQVFIDQISRVSNTAICPR